MQLPRLPAVRPGGGQCLQPIGRGSAASRQLLSVPARYLLREHRARPDWLLPLLRRVARPRRQLSGNSGQAANKEALMTRSGRRQALAGLFTGTVALVSGRSSGEAKKKCRERSCPDCTCPEPTVCLPPPDSCPVRKTCCVCNAMSETPGCQYTSVQAPMGGTPALCEEMCGGPGTTSGGEGSSLGGSTVTFLCAAGGTDCARVDCPLF